MRMRQGLRVRLRSSAAEMWPKYMFCSGKFRRRRFIPNIMPTYFTISLRYFTR